MDIQSTIRLNNGVEMPRLGLGVYKSGKDTAQAVRQALEAGYRHIDTASYYGNEREVGQAIRESGIPREELFVTTKLWNEDQRQGRQREAFEESLGALGIGYIDLYLVHWPVPGCFKETWRVMEQIAKERPVRAIGVSNFLENQLAELLEDAEIVPAVDQFEFHPYNTRESLRAFCRGKGIRCEAWSPLGRGEALDNPLIGRIAEKYGKSPAQVVLRWDLQHDVITIPKSVHRDRILQNGDIFDFSLTDEEMRAIDGLNEDRFSIDPNHFDF